MIVLLTKPIERDLILCFGIAAEEHTGYAVHLKIDLKFP
jgi:hypothetical protein